MSVFRTKLQSCPACGYPLDAHGDDFSREKGGPAPGDQTVCLDCCAILVFGEQLKLRVMTTDELMELEPEARRNLVKIQRTVRLSKGPG